jgi:hypothetical protein
VYYIKGGRLKELCWNEGQGYFEGKLSSKNIRMTPGTGLSANVISGQLKVYGNLAEFEDDYCVIYVTIGREDWSFRDITGSNSDYH